MDRLLLKMHEPTDIDRFLAHPAKGASVVFAVFFAVSSGLHIWQSWKYRSWFYTWPLPCACILTTAGFICREFTAQGNYADDLASAVQGLFYTATPVFVLPLYFIMLHIVATIRPSVVWGPPSLHFAVISCFNTAIISCTAQGAATYFNPHAREGTISSGMALIKASLILQLVMNFGFVLLLQLVHRRIETNIKQVRIAIAVLPMIALVIVRNMFRTVQIFKSPLSPLWTKEVYFWVFEACPILIFTVLLHIVHVSNFLSLAGGESHCRRRNS